MNWSQVFTSSVGRKYVMAFTGLFLIVFLLVHCYVNINVLFTGGEKNFNIAANFMSTNVLIRIMEVGLFAGFIVHIIQGYTLEFKNNSRRLQKYSINAPAKTSPWYSRSMALLGSLILLFLVIHLSDFWIPSRFGHLAEVNYDGKEFHNLYAKMDVAFGKGREWAIIVYILGCFSLSWHLVHGFQSAFQTLGWKQAPFIKTIETLGIGFSIVVPLIFALMPIFMYFDLELNIGSITFLF